MKLAILVKKTLFVLIFSSSILFSQEKNFVIGIENFNYLPFYQPAKDGTRQGIAIEIIKAFARDKKYAVTLKFMNIENLCHDLDKGLIDFRFPNNPEWMCNNTKQEGIIYSTGFIDYIDGILNLPQTSAKDINQIKVLGIIEGFSPSIYEYLISSKHLRLIRYPDAETLLQKTLNGDVDIAYMSINAGKYLLRNHFSKGEALEFNPSLPYFSSTFSLSTKKYPKIIDEFNQWLLHNNAKVWYISNKYGVYKKKPLDTLD